MTIDIPSRFRKIDIAKIRESINYQVNNGEASDGRPMTWVNRIGQVPLAEPSNESEVLNIISFGVYGPIGKCPEGIRVEFGSIDRAKNYKLKELTNPEFEGSFSDSYFNSNVIEEALDDIQSWLFSPEVVVGDTFPKEINQGERECEVVKVGRTRARIEYEMPNAGMMGGYIPIVNLFGRKLYYGEY